MQQLVLKVQEDRAPSGIAEFAMVLDRLGTSRRPIYSDANLPDQTTHVTPKVPSSSSHRASLRCLTMNSGSCATASQRTQ